MLGRWIQKLQRDASLADRGDIAGLISYVREKAKRIESAIPEQDDFTEDIVNDGGVFLALLIHFAQVEARSFPGSKRLSAADEPLEVHHIFPRAVLDRYSERDNEFVPDRIGNLTLLTRSDNEHLSDEAPADYLPTVDAEVRRVHLIPEEPEVWRVERFPDFCLQREREIARIIRTLLKDLIGAHETRGNT